MASDRSPARGEREPHEPHGSGAEGPNEQPEPDAPPLDEEELAEERARRAYLEGLSERGEARDADEHGDLPPGATHEIVKQGRDKPAEIQRRRFSLS
jgi:hypothetical protein